MTKYSHLQKLSFPDIKSKGFTLVELLVAITIISVLFGVVISSGAAIQRKSRDTKRKSDLMNIKSALQQYYADQNRYPDTLSWGASLAEGSRTYLNDIPRDPTNSAPYIYRYQPYTSRANTTTDCTNPDSDSPVNRADDNPALMCHYYFLWVELENSGDGGVVCQTPCGGGATEAKFFVQNPL